MTLLYQMRQMVKALKKLVRSLIAPPALGEDLGFFAIAMS